MYIAIIVLQKKNFFIQLKIVMPLQFGKVISVVLFNLVMISYDDYLR